ncbi:MAG: glycosyltransferase [Acidobacteria bacterium]|nr:glycosyltransferase [Acidobacteriota bacterium]
MTLALLHTAFLVINWIVAVAWLWRTTEALRHLPSVPDLSQARYAQPLPAMPLLAVIVPARNEERAIEATLRSLLASQGVTLDILAIDDRSTDATGAIMDRIAAEPASSPHTLRVLHVESLPDGWLGKTHAMALAARQTTAPWLLFTDGDVLFRRDALARAISFVEQSRDDHLVLFPTLLLRGAGERMLISMFQALSIWSSRPWRIPDPRAKRDFIGIGAFNLVRRETYKAVGGFEGLRMEVLEDVRFGYLIKRGGHRQRVVFGPGLISIRWAEGVRGIVDNLTKNFFAIFRFNIAKTLAACAGLAVLCLLPFAGFFAGRAAAFASVLTLLMVFRLYRWFSRYSGVAPRYALLFPVAACLLIFTILRSTVVTLARGGVVWRGTFYPLRELRKRAGPLW